MKMKFFGGIAFMIVNVFSHAQPFELSIESRRFNEVLVVENQQNVRIRDCVFTNVSGKYGLHIVNCENVIIEDCVVSGVGNESFSMYFSNLLPVDSSDYALSKGNFNAIGLFLYNCRNAKIKNCKITDVFGQGIKISGDDCNSAYNVSIEDSRISYTYDDAIKVEVNNDQSDYNNVLPMKGVVIRNNVIHDIGLGLTQLPYARHGMYVKARDALIEGNTVYNCLYGEGISLRNAGVVRNNKVWNCFIGCIGFWAQTNTEGSSKMVVIENNICRQDFTLDLKMRHVFKPGNDPVVKANIIQWAFYDPTRRVASIEKIIIRNNICIAGPDFLATHAMMVAFEQPRPDQELDYQGNKMIDVSGSNTFLINIPGMKNEIRRF